MRKGDKVEVLADFSALSKEWGLDYPKKGDVLTLSNIELHPNESVAAKGIFLLYFVEFPDLVGLCDYRVNGRPNFLDLSMGWVLQQIVRQNAKHFDELEQHFSDTHDAWMNRMELFVNREDDLEASKHITF